MRFLVVMWFCLMLCGCLSGTEQQQSVQIQPTTQVQLQQTVDLRDKQQLQRKFRWPITICLTALFCFLPTAMAKWKGL